MLEEVNEDACKVLSTVNRAMKESSTVLIKKLKRSMQELKEGEIIGWLVSEGTFKVHSSNPPRHGHEHLSLNRVAQSLVQHDLEHLQ